MVGWFGSRQGVGMRIATETRNGNNRENLGWTGRYSTAHSGKRSEGLVREVDV